ncbi:Ig-like domain-containing protein [Pseudomonadales bacterium]|nr:Ig-like domain-containing protein [Pseudomonadales bacterium]
MSSATVAAPTFSAPVMIEALTFRLMVTDPGGLSNSAEVVVNVGGVPPNVVAVAVSTKAVGATANQNTTMSLDGSASTDNLGIVSYQWAQFSGTAVELTNANTSVASFTAPPRLIGPAEDLAFRLTVVDTDGLTSVAEVPVTVSPATTGNRAYALTELSAPAQFGRDIESGALFVFDTSTNTGTLLEESRESVFSYVQNGLTMTLDIISSDVQSQSFTDSASGDTLTVTEAIDQYVLTLLEDGVGRDVVTVQALGSVTTFNDTQNIIVSTEAIDEVFVVSTYDFSTQIPLNVEGQTRSLLTNVSTQIGTLENGGDLQVDSLTFNADGTGFAAEKFQALTWIAQPDGHVSVEFADGEVADYYHLATRPSGDVFVTEYTNVSGVNTATAELSFVKDPSAIWDADTLAGVYTARGTFALEDGTLVTDDGDYRLAPDGTGEVEFNIVDFSTGEQTPVTSSFGICWSVSVTGELVVDRVLSRDAVVEGTSRPDTSFCAAALPAEVSFRREQTLFDVSGVNIRTVTRESRNTCGFGPVGQQNCELLVDTYFPRIYELTETFVGDPPRAGTGRMESATGEAVDIGIDSLVQDADSKLDFSSIEIVKQPQTGTVSINTSTGVITYTPVGDNSTDEFYYRVRDTDGNLSSVASVNVFIFAPVLVAPDVTANQSSLVTLDGSASTDNLGILTYQWAQVSGTAVELTNANSSITSFTAPPRLIGPAEVLAFSLTVVDTDGLTSVTEVPVTVSPATTGNRAYSLTELSAPYQFGRDIESGGLFVFDTATNTGTLLEEHRESVFSYVQSGLTMTLDIISSDAQSDTYTDFSLGDTLGDTLTVTEAIDQYVLTLLEDGVGRDVVKVQALGSLTTFNDTQNIIVSTEAIDEVFVVSVYDFSTQIPLNVEGQTRSLLTNVSTQVDTLRQGTDLQVDSLTFNADGTGFAAEKFQALNWIAQPDGHVSVVFADGEVADYYHLATRPSGDVIVTEYTYVSSVNKVTAELSFVKDPLAIWDADTLAGVYTARGTFALEDGTLVTDDADYRLAPDGTGEVEFNIIDFSTGEQTPVTSSFGICWSVSVTGELVVDRVLSRDAVVEGTSRPDTSFCAATLPAEVSFRREQTLFDVSGVNIRTVTRESRNTCGLGPVGQQNCELLVDTYFPRIYELTETFVGDPPRAGTGRMESATGEAVDIGIDSLVLDADSELDFSSIEIVKQPQTGTVSINTSTGVITYTPVGDNSTDEFYYRVRDTDGNLSNVASVNVFIFEPVLVAPDVTANQSSLVTLDGSASTDNLGIVSYQWAQVSGTPVELTNADSSVASFTAPQKLLGTTDVLEFSLTIVGANGLTSVTNVQASIEPATRGNKLFASFKYHEPTSYGSGIRPLGLFTFDTVSSVGDVVPSYYAGEDQDLDFSYTVDGLEMTVSLVGLGLPEYVYRYTNDAGDVLRYTESIVQLTLTLTDDGDEVDLFSSQSLRREVTFNETQGVEVNSSDYESTNIVAVHGFESRVPLEVENQTISLLTNVSTEIDTLDEIDGSGLQLDGLSFNEDGTGFAAEKAQSFNWFSDPENGYIRVEFADDETSEYHHVASTTSGNVVVAVYTFGNNVKIARAELSFTQDPNLIVNSDTVAGIYTSQEIWDWNQYIYIYDRSIRLAPDGTGEEETIYTFYEDGVVNYTALWSSGICWSVNPAGKVITERVGLSASEQVVVGSQRPSASFCNARVLAANSYREERTIYTLGQAVTREVTYTCSENVCEPQVRRIRPSVTKYLETFAGDPPRAGSALLYTNTGVPVDVVISSLVQDIDGSLDLTSIEIVIPPEAGSLSIDAVSGVITYTPTGTVAYTDKFAYQIRDDVGNLSNAALVDVKIAALEVTVTSSSLTPLSGELVTLSASATESGLSYTWTQTGGTAVTLSDATASSPTFIMSDVALLPNGSVDERTFSVTVANADGVTVVGEVVVTVEAALPQAFFGVEESTIPFSSGVDLGESFFASLNADGMSGYILTASQQINVNVSATTGGSAQFQVVGEGGVPIKIVDAEELVDEDGDGNADETLRFTFSLISIDMTLITDGVAKDRVLVLETLAVTAFNVTLDQPSISVPSASSSQSREYSLYDKSQAIPFSINGESRSLETDVASVQGTLDSTKLYPDVLTFDSASTGSALVMANTFSWLLDVDGHLVVTFANNDVADYYHLATRNSGDVVGVLYSDSRTGALRLRSSTSLSFVQGPVTFGDTGTLDIAGVFVALGSDGSETPTKYYRINPDGTGQEEFRVTSPDTGFEAWSGEAAGLCATVLGSGKMPWKRVQAQSESQNIPETSIPRESFCALVNSNQHEDRVSVKQQHTLFDISPTGEYRTTVVQRSNACGFDPFVNPIAGCVNTLLIDNIFSRIMSFTPFLDFPPIAKADVGLSTVGGGTIDIPVLDNDLRGADYSTVSVSQIDPSTVEIITPPNYGTATVDGVTGVIRYTADAYNGSSPLVDALYYRVKNFEGDASNAGQARITIGP